MMRPVELADEPRHLTLTGEKIQRIRVRWLVTQHGFRGVGNAPRRYQRSKRSPSSLPNVKAGVSDRPPTKALPEVRPKPRISPAA